MYRLCACSTHEICSLVLAPGKGSRSRWHLTFFRPTAWSVLEFYPSQVIHKELNWLLGYGFVSSWLGVCLLGITVEQCDSDMFTKNCASWMRTILQLIQVIECNNSNIGVSLVAYMGTPSPLPSTTHSPYPGFHYLCVYSRPLLL